MRYYSIRNKRKVWCETYGSKRIKLELAKIKMVSIGCELILDDKKFVNASELNLKCRVLDRFKGLHNED